MTTSNKREQVHRHASIHVKIYDIQKTWSEVKVKEENVLASD